MNARRAVWEPPAQAASDLCREKAALLCRTRDLVSTLLCASHHRHVLGNVNENYHFLQLF